MAPAEGTPEGIGWASYASTNDPRENTDYRDHVLANGFSRAPRAEDREMALNIAHDRLQGSGQLLPESPEEQVKVLVDHYRQHRPPMPGESEVALVLGVVLADCAVERALGVHWIMGSRGWPVLADEHGREHFDPLCAAYDSVYLDGEHPLVLLDLAFPPAD
ncbi:hypothetical protein [Zhihengliuella flava]|uniref:Uncharacterized protein n=1 Tax=Zhihengliuella flava TaxID=1285193 RepID=A0A931GIX8_9MICC|nr:hypothetical protein [Zhihengliuella flava]MBG6084741.1 hypothetical protein [Zhihengliuella flava]